MIHLKFQNKVNQPIPDNDDKGLVTYIHITEPGEVKDINVHLDISHPFISDLQVFLTSPKGKKVILHNRHGGDNKVNLIKTYTAEKLDSFNGEEVTGKWTLTVKDFADKDSGTLNHWGMDVKCQEPKSYKSEINIPDKDPVGLSTKQFCDLEGRISNINMTVNIEHPFIGDLQVKVIAPSGKSIMLHNREGAGKNNLNTTYKEDVLSGLTGEPCKGIWELQVKDFAPRDQGKLKEWTIDLDYMTKDDLKKIEGIGPKIEEKLNNAGIFTFASLSVTQRDQLKSILEAAGERYRMHDPTTWPQQAGLAALGQWDKLKVWQDELDGGRLVE